MKIATLYVISKLIWDSFSIGYPPNDTRYIDSLKIVGHNYMIRDIAGYSNKYILYKCMYLHKLDIQFD